MIQDNTITREDFEKSARLNDLEVFTEQEVNAWLSDKKKLIEKSEVDELDEIEKGELNDFIIDSKSLNKVVVIEADLTKSVMFFRPSQVKWDKDEEGNLMKARSGVYKDTPYNRKKGIVGMRFGQTKGAKKGTEKKGKDMKKPTMNNLDWGKTTEERNSNLDKYESLKTEDEKVKFLNELKGNSETGEKKEGKEEKENKGNNKRIKEFQDDASPKQKAVIDAMIKDEDFSKITEDMPVAKETRFYENLSKKLALFGSDGNNPLSKEYENKPFGEFQQALKKKVKELF
jgi:hypothetical protein